MTRKRDTYTQRKRTHRKRKGIDLGALSPELPPFLACACTSNFFVFRFLCRPLHTGSPPRPPLPAAVFRRPPNLTPLPSQSFFFTHKERSTNDEAQNLGIAITTLAITRLTNQTQFLRLPSSLPLPSPLSLAHTPKNSDFSQGMHVKLRAADKYQLVKDSGACVWEEPPQFRDWSALPGGLMGGGGGSRRSLHHSSQLQNKHRNESILCCSV